MPKGIIEGETIFTTAKLDHILSKLTAKGNVIPGLVIAFLGVTTNGWSGFAIAS